MLTKLTQAEIGRKVGGKNHAIVTHACKVVNKLICQSKGYKRGFHLEIDLIHHKINGTTPPKANNHIEMETGNSTTADNISRMKEWHKPSQRIIPFIRTTPYISPKNIKHEAWDRLLSNRTRRRMQKDSFVECCF